MTTFAVESKNENVCRDMKCTRASAFIRNNSASEFKMLSMQEHSLISNTPQLALSLSFGASLPCPFIAVHHAFRFHAITRPHSIAVEHLHESITYAELDITSHRLAFFLRAGGIKPGERVCIVARRGIAMIIAILAILKSGGTYIPLDGGISTDAMLQHVLLDSRPKFVLACRPYMARFSSLVQCFCLETLLDELAAPEVTKQWRPSIRDLSSSENGAYIIYTSGTTGKSKGVLVTHENLTNLLCLYPGNLGMRPGMRVSQLLNIAFDMCAWEILGSLMNGCTLCLRGSDKASWKATLHSVDLVISTPSILAAYDPDEYPNIKVVATAGEPCPQALADKWGSRAIFYNCCGPTETTIVNTVRRHSPGLPLSIGKPTPNNSVYVLDADMRPVDVGKPGTLWAGGAGIANGYINLPDLTAKRFLPDYFLGFGTMFNTGDIGKLRPDGEIEHLGRTDDQVKVKGFRVELDGVTAVLSKCPTVTSATTLLIGKELVAFLAPETVDLAGVMAASAAALPYYAIPCRFWVLPALPLTANGKVDKGSLRRMAPSSHKLEHR